MHTTNRQTIAIGVSALGIAAAGLATVAMGDSPSGRHAAQADAAAGRTASAPATSHLGSLSSTRTAFSGTSLSGAFDGPAAASRTTDRPSARPTSLSASAGSVTPTSLPAGQKPLASVHVGGPVTVQVDTEQVVATANSAVKTATSTVAWAKSTVGRTVQSLPVKASVQQNESGTTVSVSTLGTTASAHVG